MTLERAPRLAHDVTGMTGSTVGAGIGGARRPSRSPRRRPRGCSRPGASHGPPLEMTGVFRLTIAHPLISRVAPDRQQQCREERRARHDRGDLEVLPRRVVEPADRPEAVERSARRGPPSCWRRTRRRSPRRGARSRAAARGPTASSTSRPDRAQLLHRPVATPFLELDRDVGHGRRCRPAPGSPPRPPPVGSRVAARRSTSRTACARRRRWAACRPR